MSVVNESKIPADLSVEPTNDLYGNTYGSPYGRACGASYRRPGRKADKPKSSTNVAFWLCFGLGILFLSAYTLNGL